MPPKKKPDKKDGPELKPKAGPPNAKKDLKKGIKGPVRIVDRLKIAGGKKKVQKRVKKPKKPKTPKGQPVAPVAPPEAPPPVVVVKKPKESKPWLIICVLWLFEIMQVTSRAWKKSWLKKSPGYGSPRKIGDNATEEILALDVDLGPVMEDTWSYVTAASLATVALSVLLQNRPKFIPMIVTLALYALTSICGVLTTLITHRLIDLHMIGGQILWLVSNPLRFWLIFTQTAPTKWTTSRLVVLVNLAVIYVVDYAWTLVMALIGGLTNKVYLAIFAVLLFLMLLWLAYLVFTMKSYQRLPDRIDDVVLVYAKAGSRASASFRSRQTLRQLLTFLPLLYPWSAFFVTREAIALTVDRIDDKFLAYRFDLASAVITIPCVSLGLWKLKWPRYEVQDLLALAFAHLLNVLALSIFFYIVFHSPLIRRTSLAFMAAAPSTNAVVTTHPSMPNRTSTTSRMRRNVLKSSATRRGPITTPAFPQAFQKMLEKVENLNLEFPITEPTRVVRAEVNETAPKILLLPMIMAGIGFGIAPVCYFHFIWIQCPFRWKAPIIATSFTTNFLFGWATRTYLTWFDQYHMITLLVVVGVCAAWHVMFSAYFWYHIEAPEQRGETSAVYF